MSERDELWQRASTYHAAHNEPMVQRMADFAAEERNRAWNEALEKMRRECAARLGGRGAAQNDGLSLAAHLTEALKRPPPAQQDDKSEAEIVNEAGEQILKHGLWRKGDKSELDLEARARELLPGEWTEGPGYHPGAARDAAIALAQEAQQAMAERIAREIDSINRSAPRRSVEEHCAEIARSHARPAPGTREERYREALRMIAKHPCGGAQRPGDDWHCGECAWCIAKEALEQP